MGRFIGFLKGIKMKRMCVLSTIIGVCFFIFGILCLLSPYFSNYNYYNQVGLLSLDELGVFAVFTGAVLYGTSMIALAVASHKSKLD